MRNISGFFLLISLLISCSDGQVREIKPDNRAISYTGRFYFPDDGRAVSDWPGTSIRCRFTGKSLGIRIKGSSEVQFNVFIDDLPVKVVSCNNGDIISVAENLNKGKHSIQIFKRTESFVGRAEFLGFVTEPGAKILPWNKPPKRKIEFIGNSITCGYGVEGASRHEHFKPETENNYMTYAAILSRRFDADYSIIAHSGLGIVRHYGDSVKVSSDPQMPERYKRTLDSSDSVRWDFTSWRPDIVMINLGTNDFSTEPYPDKNVFNSTYISLIQEIRGNYGDIPVFCIAGPLIGEPCSSYVKEVTETMGEEFSDTNVFFIGLERELLCNDGDFGSDEHPSVTGQVKMADEISPYITKIMGWKETTPSE